MGLPFWLSPLWVWIAFGEALPVWTVVGGLMIFATLLGHEVALYRWARAGAASEGVGARAGAASAAGTTSTVIEVVPVSRALTFDGREQV